VRGGGGIEYKYCIIFYPIKYKKDEGYGINLKFGHSNICDYSAFWFFIFFYL
jgi:hypothetical protein